MFALLAALLVITYVPTVKYSICEILRSYRIRELDDEIKWLNMNLRPGKECENYDDIIFLSEGLVVSDWLYFGSRTLIEGSVLSVIIFF